MRRLYIKLPDQERCEVVVNALREHGVPTYYLYVVSRTPTELDGVGHASAFDAVELARGVGPGLLLGGIAGLIGAWLVVTFPPAGTVLAEGMAPYLLMGGAGAVLGMFVSALRSRGIPAHRVSEYESAVEEGQHVLLVDIPRAWAEIATGVINRLDPDIGVVVARPPK